MVHLVYCVRHHALHFTCINSFNPHNLVVGTTIITLPHLTDEETELQTGR